jgi:hypothetical protein
MTVKFTQVTAELQMYDELIAGRFAWILRCGGEVVAMREWPSRQTIGWLSEPMVVDLNSHLRLLQAAEGRAE